MGYSKNVVFIIATASLTMLAGCKTELSPAGYDVTMALVQATGRQSDAALKNVRQAFDERLADGSISQDEADSLAELLAMAESGDWKSASEGSRELLAKQRGE